MADVLLLGKNLATGMDEAMSKLKVDNSTGQLKSSTTTGTAPLSVASTTAVANLNADQTDGYDATDFFNLDHADVSGILDANHGGTNKDTSGDTGIPQIVGGTWTVPAVVGLTYGGTGSDLDSTGPGALVQASNGAVVTVETLDETRGGTGQGGATPYAVGDILYASGTSALGKLAAGSNAEVLTLAGGVPTWSSPAAPGAHAASHEVGGGDLVTLEDLETGAGTAGWALTNDGDGTVSWTNYGATLPDGAANNNATLRWDSSGDAWQVNTNYDVDSSGNVTDGTWTADVIGTTYGGTGADTSAWTGVPYFSAAGTWNKTAAIAAGDLPYGSATNTLALLGKGTSYQSLRMNVGATLPEWGTAMPAGGGTGLTTYTAAGRLIYSTGATSLDDLAIGTANQFLRVNAGATAPEWDTINLDDLSNVDAMSEASQDILFYDTDAWNRMAVGSNGQFLGVSGGALAWLDPGSGYTWTLDGDTGTPEPITDGNTATFTGGNGIDTAVSATDVLTISAKADVTTGTPVVPINVAANGLGLDLSTIDGLGLAVLSGQLIIDLASTVTFAGAQLWSFPVGVTARGLYVTGAPVDANHAVNKTYVDGLLSGLLWKDPVDVRSLVGNASVSTINGLSEVTGDAYVLTDAGDLTEGGTLAVTIGDLVEFNGVQWIMIEQAVTAVPPIGVRAILSKTTALISPYSEGTDDNKIVEFPGNSLTGADTGDAVDSAAVLVSDTAHVGYYDNSGYVFEFDTSVAASAWVQFTGAGQINAGAGLTKSGNTLDIGDGSTGNINGLAVGADTLGAAVDDSTIEISSNVLAVKADGIGATEIDETESYTWTSGTHDFQGTIKTDALGESTSAAGVTVDGLLIKDECLSDDSIVTDAGGCAQYDVLASIAAGSLMKADADLPNASKSVLGIAMETIGPGSSVEVARFGRYMVNMIASPGLTVLVSDPVFLSLTAGLATNDVSAFQSGDTIIRLGFVTDASMYAADDRAVIEINIGEPVLIA